MVTLDEEFYTNWLLHASDEELIQEYIPIMAMYSSPFLPEFSLSDILGAMEEKVLYEAMKRFIFSSGSISVNKVYQHYFPN